MTEIRKKFPQKLNFGVKIDIVILKKKLKVPNDPSAAINLTRCGITIKSFFREYFVYCPFYRKSNGYQIYRVGRCNFYSFFMKCALMWTQIRDIIQYS